VSRRVSLLSFTYSKERTASAATPFGVHNLVKEMDKSVLHHMLSKLSPDEVIENFIEILATLFDDEETFHRITKMITIHVQTRQISQGAEDLRSFEEPHQKELFRELLKKKAGGEWTVEKIFEATFQDWKGSGLTFEKWFNS
jgi:hypothetical protein